MIYRTFAENKKQFLRYNNFRKRTFSELSPKESETVLYLLPWLLSINHPSCPGYISNLKRPFRVFNIDNEIEIRKRELVFKWMFGIRKRGSLLKTPPQYCLIQGLYTIGSVGTVSQTSGSDCDIWVCYKKGDFKKLHWIQLNQKVNMIKDWMDIKLKMPVFFFFSEVDEIRNNRFGNVDSEGSGSTQASVLKEEFYRTCIVVCGKIPLWWICDNEIERCEYGKALTIIERNIYGEFDLIDFGDLEKIDENEYFGAALWQIHKSLTHPLKSIIKMSLLKMVLDAPGQRLICNRFRNRVFDTDADDEFPDPMIYTINIIFNYYREKNDVKTLNFLKECFYMRCEIKPYSRKNDPKKLLAQDLYRKYPLKIKKRLWLSRFAYWDFNAQVELGTRIFGHLLDCYREISAAHGGREASEIDKRDLTILGRKISTFYEQKPDKILYLHKPTDTLNLANLTLSLVGKEWHAFSGTDYSRPLVSNSDILYVIAFIVWNDLFVSTRIHMEPNSTSVSIQEIINLGRRMRNFIGTYDVSDIIFSNYLEKEYITRLLVIVSFDNSPWEKDINDFGVIYKNSWGEGFVRRFKSPHKLEAFINRSCKDRYSLETSYYVQRNSTYYEKIIERTKRILMPPS